MCVSCALCKMGVCLSVYPVQFAGYVCVYFVPVLGSCVCLNRVPLAACVCVCVCVCVCILCLLQDGRVCLCVYPVQFAGNVCVCVFCARSRIVCV